MSLFGPFSLLAGAASALFGDDDDQNVTQTTRVDLPEWMQQFGPQIGEAAQDIYNLPYQPYTGQRVYDIAPETATGADQLTRYAMGPGAEEQGARAMAMNTMGGAYMPGMMSNPFIGRNTPTYQAQGIGAYGADNPYLGRTTSGNLMDVAAGFIGQGPAQAANPYIGAQTSVGRNPYAGANPYLERAIQGATGDMARAYNETMLPRIDAMNRASGSFGNTGMQDFERRTQQDLNRQIGDVTNTMRMGDYGTQQQLAESDIARRVGAQQGDLARNVGAQQSLGQFNALQRDPLRFGAFALGAAGQQAGLEQGDIARNAGLAQQQGMFNAGQLTGADTFGATARNQAGMFNVGNTAADISRNAGLWNTDANRYAQMTDAERNRQMNAANMYPGFNAADIQRGQTLLGVGDMYQNYQQQLLNQGYDDWMREQQYPRQQLGLLQDVYRTGLGAAGQSQTGTTSGGGNPFGNFMGGAMMGQSLFGGGGNLFGNWFNSPMSQQMGSFGAQSGLDPSYYFNW